MTNPKDGLQRRPPRPDSLGGRTLYVYGWSPRPPSITYTHTHIYIHEATDQRVAVVAPTVPRCGTSTQDGMRFVQGTSSDAGCLHGFVWLGLVGRLTLNNLRRIAAIILSSSPVSFDDRSRGGMETKDEIDMQSSLLGA